MNYNDTVPMASTNICKLFLSHSCDDTLFFSFLVFRLVITPDLRLQQSIPDITVNINNHVNFYSSAQQVSTETHVHRTVIDTNSTAGDDDDDDDKTITDNESDDSGGDDSSTYQTPPTTTSDETK